MKSTEGGIQQQPDTEVNKGLKGLNSKVGVRYNDEQWDKIKERKQVEQKRKKKQPVSRVVC